MLALRARTLDSTRALTGGAAWLWRGLLDLALPPRCAACGRIEVGDPLCPQCRRALPRPEATAPAPARPLAELSCAASYAGEIEHWIQAFKYPARGSGADPRAVAVALCLIRDAARAVAGPLPDLVVPVPLHPRRLRSRGFNPAAVLAREVARTVGAKHATQLLLRTRDTKSQTGLDRRARARNVAHAFRCTGEAPSVVWIVDDVATTGATLSECARTLGRAGADRVAAVCIAQTPAPPHDEAR